MPADTCSVRRLLGYGDAGFCCLQHAVGEECCNCCVGLPIYHKGGCLLTECDMTTLLMDVVF